MKKLLVLLLVLGLASVSFAAQANARADFDPLAQSEEPFNYTLGNLAGQGKAVATPGDWASSWGLFGNEPVDPTFQVVEGGCEGSGHSDPSQHLQMFDADTSSRGAERDMNAWTGDFTYEFCYKWTGGGPVATLQHQFENAAGDRPLNIKWEAAQQFRVNDTTLVSNFKTPGGDLKSPVGNWVQIRIVCDMDTATFDLYWENTDNGMSYVGTKVGFKDGDFVNDKDVVYYRADAPKMNTTDGQGIELDHIRITPEPATIMLLGLGGLALIRRKR